MKINLPYKLLNFYPPFLGAGIWVKNSTKNSFTVALYDLWFNRNVYGTHFGGSLYSMCDPFFILILHKNLGNAYIYWDKSAQIEYLKPARGKITARFEISPEHIDSIRRELEALKKQTYKFKTDLTDRKGQVVASVIKEVYIKEIK